MTETLVTLPFPITTPEQVAFFDAAKRFVVASHTDRSAVSEARRRMDKTYSEMIRAQQQEKTT